MSKNHYTSEYGLNFRREREQKEESDVVSFNKMQINPLMDRNCFFFLGHQIKLCVTSRKRSAIFCSSSSNFFFCFFTNITSKTYLKKKMNEKM